MQRQICPYCRREEEAYENSKSLDPLGLRRAVKARSKIMKFKIRLKMEENNNLTAERSLEIITEQIAKSRKDVSKDVGLSLYVAGLCTMGMAILIGLCIFFTANLAYYPLYVTLPVVIYFADRFAKRNKPKVPASFVGTMVNKTWQTFGIFVFSFFVFTFFYNFLMGRMESPEVVSRLSIHPLRTILLLMGMTITMNGYILKSRWMVWCGIIGGIGGFIWESFYVTQTIAGLLFSYFNENYCGITFGIIPGLIIALFAFVGLTLPGLMLKRQK